MNLNRLLFTLVLGLLFVLPGVGVTHAQTASALIREGDTLPGDASGFLISDINTYSAQNGVGGFAFNVETFDEAGTGSIFHLWGNTTGGSGAVLRTQSTLGDSEQTAFFSVGMSDSGMLAYIGQSTNTVSGATGLRGAWVDSNLILNEQDSIPTLPGEFSDFNSGVGITRDGTPYWAGRYSSTQGGSYTGFALFYDTEMTVLLESGDSIGGTTLNVDTRSNSIDADLRFSANGTNYIDQVLADSGSTDNNRVMVSNGTAMLAGGSIIREQSSVPTSIGGLAGERYDNFDRFGITESGSFMITGDTDASTTQDEFIMIDGEIVLREGDVIDGFTLNGSIESAFQNEDGDWVAVWDVDAGTDNLEAMIMNGEILMLEGNLVDWNNDGLIDGSDQNGFISDFTSGRGGLVLSDRDAFGDVRLLFNADVDLNGTLREGGFSMSISAVPEPSSMLVLLFAGAPVLVRRRRTQ